MTRVALSTSRFAAGFTASPEAAAATRGPIGVTAKETTGPSAEEQTLRALRRDAARDPDDPIKWLRLAMFATLVGAYEDAIDPFHTALQLQDGSIDPSGWAFMGIAAANTGRNDDALLAFTKLTDAAPTDALAWVLTAMTLEILGRLEERCDALERAAALEPSDPDEMVAIGYALAGLERYDEALEMDERAIAATPGNAKAWANKGAHLARSKGSADALDQAVDDAFNTALECASTEVRLLPSILRDYGIALVQLGRERDALPVLLRAKDLDHGARDWTIWRTLGLVYTELEDDEAALEQDKRAVELAPHLPIAWRSMGVDLFALERYEEALFAFTRATELAPDHALMWHAKGLALWRLERFEEALRVFEEVTRIDDGYADGWLAKGACLDAVGRSEEAVQALRKAVGLVLVGQAPERPELWTHLGAAYLHLDDSRAAEHAFRAGYRVDHSEAMASSVIDALARQNRERDALDFLAREKPRGADEGLLAYWRAILHGRAEEEKPAVAELRRAVRAWSARGADHERARAASRALREYEAGQRGAATWTEYWFGPPRLSVTTALGALLFIALLADIALPVAHPDAADSAQRWAAITLAAAVLLVLFSLPTVRKIKAGSGSFEVETIVVVEREHRELTLPTEIGIAKITELPGLDPTALPGFADMREDFLDQEMRSARDAEAAPSEEVAS